MRKVKFINGYFYHIFNRGVEKRNIFLDTDDYLRFVYYLFEFNNKKLIPDIPFNKRKGRLGGLATDNNNGEKLVEIVCFCLMPNHFHLLLKQIKDNGISLFLHKLSSAYTKYFNIKNNRIGALFQGTFKAKLVDREAYLNHLFYYILANPIDLIAFEWKEKGIKDFEKTNNFLKNYRWSSYKDFLGQLNFPFLFNKKFFIESFGELKTFENFINDLTILNFSVEFKNLLLE